MSTIKDCIWSEETGVGNLWDISAYRVCNFCHAGSLSWEDRQSKALTLREHLLTQLYCIFGVNDPVAKYLELLIDHVDNKVFLRSGPELSSEVSSLELAQEFGVTETKLLELVDILQEFEPSGVGCFSIQESLLLQLRHIRYEPDDLVVRIVRDHYDLLIGRNSCKLRKVTDCSEQDLREVVDLLRCLYSTPGRAFSCDVDMFVKPDVVVIKCDDGKHKIYLNNEDVPRLRISGYYRDFVNAAKTKEDKNFIRDK